MNLYAIIASLVAAAACLVGFYELADDVKASVAVAKFDRVVGDWLAEQRSHSGDLIMKFFTYAGGIGGVSLLTLALVFSLQRHDRMDDANFSLILILGGTALANGLKPILKRVRPEEAKAVISQPRSSSFPSGHSMAALCLALAAFLAVLVAPTPFIIPKTIVAVGCLVYAFLVGVSRVYLGVHWPSDVIAAWLLGGAWISIAIAVHRIWFV